MRLPFITRKVVNQFSKHNKRVMSEYIHAMCSFETRAFLQTNDSSFYKLSAGRSIRLKIVLEINDSYKLSTRRSLSLPRGKKSLSQHLYVNYSVELNFILFYFFFFCNMCILLRVIHHFNLVVCILDIILDSNHIFFQPYKIPKPLDNNII